MAIPDDLVGGSYHLEHNGAQQMLGIRAEWNGILCPLFSGVYAQEPCCVMSLHLHFSP